MYRSLFLLRHRLNSAVTTQLSCWSIGRMKSTYVKEVFHLIGLIRVWRYSQEMIRVRALCAQVPTLRLCNNMSLWGWNLPPTEVCALTLRLCNNMYISLRVAKMWQGSHEYPFMLTRHSLIHVTSFNSLWCWPDITWVIVISFHADQAFVERQSCVCIFIELQIDQVDSCVKIFTGDDKG